MNAFTNQANHAAIAPDSSGGMGLAAWPMRRSRSSTAGSAPPCAATGGGCSPPSSSWCSRASSSTPPGRRSRASTTRYGPYLSPFYSPELFGGSPHAWFGPKPGWWPAWLPFSPALLILPFPGLFRLHLLLLSGRVLQGVLGRSAGLRGRRAAEDLLGRGVVSADPAEHPPLFPVRRAAVPPRAAARRVEGALVHGRRRDGRSFGIGVGTLVLATNVVLLGGYTLGCHSMRHVIGGYLDRLARRPVRRLAYDCSSCLNRSHMRWAW